MAKVLLLYNAPVLPDDHIDAVSERDLLQTVDAVHEALITHEHQVAMLALTDSPQLLLDTIETVEPDVVFNLFEGFGDRPASEYHVAGVLDWLRIPYTGCPVEAMVLGRDKVRTKQVLRGAGLPTADFFVVDNVYQLPTPKTWPVIVKPVGTDASIGIDQESVVNDQASLKKRVALMLERYQMPALVESYLPGPEFNVGVVAVPALQALPIAEMVYTPQAGVAWPIVSYASKWEPGSPEDLAMQPRCPAQIDADLTSQLQDIALATFRLIGCRDVARIDIRLDAQGKPHVLELNPNPDLGATAGLARMLKVAGISYNHFIHQLVVNHLPVS